MMTFLLTRELIKGGSAEPADANRPAMIAALSVSGSPVVPLIWAQEKKDDEEQKQGIRKELNIEREKLNIEREKPNIDANKLADSLDTAIINESTDGKVIKQFVHKLKEVDPISHEKLIKAANNKNHPKLLNALGMPIPT